MSWGGNHSLEVTKKEYIKQIQEMRIFKTGAKRSKKEGKGRYDLLPWDAIHERVNKYQKKLNKEIKDLLKVSPNENYRGARKHLKRVIRHSYEPSPCSDCWSGCDREKKNKIVFCIDRD